MTRIVVAAGTLAPGQGGIASVARMTRRALEMSGQSVSALSYLDGGEIAVAAKATGARGNKVVFAALAHAAAIGASHLIFDSAGLARARPRLPGLRRPYAVWMHGVEAWENLRPDAEASLRQAALVLVNSKYTLARFERLHGALPQAAVCQLATESDDEAGHADFSGPPVVLILARMAEGEGYKGHDALIAAWPAVAAAVPGARLVIAGGGSGVPAVKALAAASPVASAIDVLGFVPESDLPGLWRRAHAFAMPSRGEGFGLVYIEAMRHGVPVVASTHDAGQEINIDGCTGYNVSLDRPGELTDRLIALLADRTHAHKLGRAGLERWRQDFRFSSFRKRFDPLAARFLNPAR